MVMADLAPGDFRRVLNHMNGDEVRQVQLYFKLGLIEMLKRDWGTSPVRTILSGLSTAELETVVLYFYLGVLTHHLPLEDLSSRLRAKAIELIKDLDQ